MERLEITDFIFTEMHDSEPRIIQNLFLKISSIEELRKLLSAFIP